MKTYMLFMSLTFASLVSQAAGDVKIICESQNRVERFVLEPAQKSVKWSYLSNRATIVKRDFKLKTFSAGTLPYSYKFSGCAPYNMDEACFEVNMRGLQSETSKLYAYVSSRPFFANQKYNCFVVTTGLQTNW